MRSNAVSVLIVLQLEIAVFSRAFFESMMSRIFFVRGGMYNLFHRVIISSQDSACYMPVDVSLTFPERED